MNKTKRVFAGVMAFILLVSLILSVVGGIFTSSEEDEHDHTHETEIVETTNTIPEEEEIQHIEKQRLINTVKNSFEGGDTDIQVMLTKLSIIGGIPFECTLSEIPNDFMPALKAPVKNFTEGAMLIPATGTQPFIAYMFKTENVNGLIEELNEQVNPSWNIHSVETEVVCESFSEYVFFALVA